MAYEATRLTADHLVVGWVSYYLVIEGECLPSPPSYRKPSLVSPPKSAMAASVPPAPPPPPIDHAHHSPPPHVRAVHKALQKSVDNDDIPILDFSAGEKIPEYHRKRLKLRGTIPRERTGESFARFMRTAEAAGNEGVQETEDVEVWEHSSVPGSSYCPRVVGLH